MTRHASNFKNNEEKPFKENIFIYFLQVSVVNTRVTQDCVMSLKTCVDVMMESSSIKELHQ